jgi:multiple sugar transport system substrate-binding protein
MSSRLSRRDFLILSGTAALGALLAACSQPTTEPVGEVPPDEAPQGQPVAEAVTIRYGRHDPAAGVDVTIEEFSAEYPHITVEKEQIASFHEKISALAAAGTLPDVVRSWEAMVLEMGRNNQFIDLQSSVDATEDFNPQDFYENWWDYPVEEGKRYGIPDAVAPHVTFYNADLFEQLGVEPPNKDSFTWDDFEQKARAISDPENLRWGSETIPVGWHMYTVKMVWQNGGRYYSPDYRECWIGRPEAVEAIQYWADLLLDGNVMPTPSQLAGIGGEGVEATLFLDSKIAMDRNGSWYTGDLVEAGFRFNIVPEPSKVQRDTITHGAFNAIANTSKHKDAAWTWINYNCSTRGIYNYCADAKFPGSRRSTNEIEPHPWVADVDFDVNWDVVPEALTYGHVLPGPANEGEALKIIGDALEAIYAGNAKAADLLPEIAPRVTRVISEL